MLSPASYHLKIPKPHRDNLAKRLAVLRRCRQDAAYRGAAFELCKRDVFAFVNLFGWQNNPKKIGKEIGPFVSWDFQDVMIRTTMDRLFGEWPDDMLWEKSREMGATWWALFLSVWLCLFHPNKRVLCISHSEKAVDQAKSEGTLFAKIQFILDHLPNWMTEGRVHRRKMGFSFPGRSTISGDASTGRAGVGDRVTLVLLDEFSKQREGYEIWGQTADTGPRLVIGTHYGIAGCYYDLTKRPDMRKLVLHWTLHPEKRRGWYRSGSGPNHWEPLDPAYVYPEGFRPILDGTPAGGPHPGIRSPWYDHECRRRSNARDVAMHLDIDPQGSTWQFFDAPTIRRLQDTYCRDPYWQGDLYYDRDTVQPIRLVEQQDGPLRLWFHPHEDSVPLDRYGAGADVAVGSGATPSCLSLINSIGEKVAEYTNAFINPEDFGCLCVAMCRLFRTAGGDGARFAWEMAGPGLKLGSRVIELGYRNVYYRTQEFELGKTVSDSPGWYPTNSNKRLLLEDYRAALCNGEVVNRSHAALDECLDFLHINGKVIHGAEEMTKNPTGARVNHGDHVIADALAWKMNKEVVTAVVKSKPNPQAPPVGSLAWRRMQSKAAELEDVYS